MSYCIDIVLLLVCPYHVFYGLVQQRLLDNFTPMSSSQAWPPPLTTIMFIILQDISSRPEFNGCFACICGPFNVESRRWPVRVILKQGVVRN